MKISLLLAALGVVLFVVGLRYVDPAPPRQVVMATGAAGGAYRGFGERYREALAKAGITVVLRETSGSVENLRLLKSGEADVAFVQTGSNPDPDNDGLEALAGLGYEPLWVFYRGEPLTRLAQLRGRKLAIGDDQSGTQVLARKVLEDNGLRDPANELALGGQAAAAALREGRVEAAFFVASVGAPLLQSLLRDPSLRLLDFDRAGAYAARHRWLTRLTLPEGVIDLERNIPDGDIHLVSPAITLVARPDFHPAVAALLIRAASAIHGQAGIFEKAGEFPSAACVDFPLSDDARHALTSGPSFLSRHLPFWLASAIERLAFLILPLLTLLIPLLRMAPPIYVWRVRRQIYRWYEKLIRLEGDLRAADGPARDEIRGRLTKLGDEVTRVRVPLSYMDELFRLRAHIAFVLNLHGQVTPCRDAGPAA